MTRLFLCFCVAFGLGWLCRELVQFERDARMREGYTARIIHCPEALPELRGVIIDSGKQYDAEVRIQDEKEYQEMLDCIRTVNGKLDW